MFTLGVVGGARAPERPRQVGAQGCAGARGVPCALVPIQTPSSPLAHVRRGFPAPCALAVKPPDAVGAGRSGVTRPVRLQALVQVYAQCSQGREAWLALAPEGAMRVEATGHGVARLAQGRAFIHVFAPGTVAPVARQAVAREGSLRVPAAGGGMTGTGTPAFIGVDAGSLLLPVSRSARADVPSGQVGARLVRATGIAVGTLVEVFTATEAERGGPVLSAVRGQIRGRVRREPFIARTQKRPFNVLTRGVRRAGVALTLVDILALSPGDPGALTGPGGALG